MEIEQIISELTVEEKAGLCSGRDYWHTKPVERLGIESVMMCDGPHGLRKQTGEGDHLGIRESIETVCYPSASALASSFDREVLEQLGDALGAECQAEHVSMLLGPGMNIKRSPLCGRNFEYFSEDPHLTGELAASYIGSLQSRGVAACVKHFAVNNQETRRMSGTSNVEERTLHEIYLPAFETAVKKGKTRAVMCAYNALNGTFCAEHGELLNGILREKWGFDGMVVTDWGAVKDRNKGLCAGVDLEMPGGPGAQDVKIVEAVKNKTLDEAVLDKAVRNVLQFVTCGMENQKKDSTIDRAECEALSAGLETQCAVLLKNEEILPLPKESRVVFIGEFAQKPRFQGAGSSHINVRTVTGAVEAAEKKGIQTAFAKGYDVHEDAVNEELIKEAVEAAQEAEIAVVFAGLPEKYETEGCDRADLDMPAYQNRLIAEVAKVQPNTVVVLHGGAPVALPWINEVKAVLCMYLGGQGVGEAAVQLLYGEVSPSGKLAETWPVKIEDNPSYLNFPGENGVTVYREGIFVGYRYYDAKKMEVLFPFGHGLSYTNFEYSALCTDKQEMDDTEQMKVSCKIKNSGMVQAKEAVQLYVCPPKGEVRRPVRELKGFEKVELLPGEEKTVEFTLDKRAFAYYEEKIHDWYVESGNYTIEIGASSRDIRLAKAVTVHGTTELPVTYTRESTVGELLKTAKGRAVIQNMLPQTSGKEMEASGREHTKNMGEGSDAMVQSMMMGMPLQSIVTFGRMTEEQLDGLLRMLNQP